MGTTGRHFMMHMKKKVILEWVYLCPSKDAPIGFTLLIAIEPILPGYMTCSP